MTLPAARLLADAPAVLFIVYTPGADAVAQGYEPWLVSVDNPFFNAIPGVHHYANWKFDRTLFGAPPAYTYFDFQALAAAGDLERVWFNPDLDGFRTEWIRLWGYGAPSLSAAQANAYLMHPAGTPLGTATEFACILAGHGTPPADCDIAWSLTETIRKHYALGKSGAPWRVPVAEDNPLGFDWIAVRYGDSLEALATGYRHGGEDLAILARRIAAP